jgi:O-methyltransferase
LRSRLKRWLSTPAGPRERELLRTLASKFELRAPTSDAPPFSDAHDRDAPPGLLNRSGMLATAFRFAAANRVPGDYYEFGTFRGATARLAWRHGSRLLERPFRLRLFDSFEGLPEASGVDAGAWEAGSYAATAEEVEAALADEHVPPGSAVLTAGFYEDSLTPELAQQLLREGSPPAIAWVDCDLYESAADVLRFLTPLVQTGTVVCFDDWFTFRGAPDRGEQRAAAEWLAANDELALLPYLNFGWHGLSFIVHRRGEADGPAAT